MIYHNETTYNLNIVLASFPPHAKIIQTISGGHKERVDITGALDKESEVLHLDELTPILYEMDRVKIHSMYLYLEDHLFLLNL